MTCDHKSLPGQPCKCGAVVDGIVQDGRWINIPLMLRDGASKPHERKTLQMMTDSEKKTMRDSVRGMTQIEAAKLPIYDDFRGLLEGSGAPMPEMMALRDGATYQAPAATTDQCRAEAARDHMIHQQNNAWRSEAQNDNRTLPTVTRDGRPMSSLSDSERAREEMVYELNNQWRSDQ
ncbi:MULTISPECIES: hypothetical protein [unclassified Rhizobium]|uniref:hypothetical protein n=1 Tax=unclassified Rhizobium TaxID=2613769 RepID=UPI00288A6417|nr:MULTISPECIES: hypothetical protein [unclassified Rhizobium]